MDRRIRKTKEAIKKAFVDELNVKNIVDISVTKICEICDISRSTFYSHYSDVYDVLDDVENDILIFIENDNLNLLNTNRTIDTISKTVVDWTLKNRVILSALVKSHGYFFMKELENKLIRVIKDVIKREYELKPGISDKKIDLTLNFIMAGYSDLYKSIILSNNENIEFTIKYYEQLSDAIWKSLSIEK